MSVEEGSDREVHHLKMHAQHRIQPCTLMAQVSMDQKLCGPLGRRGDNTQPLSADHC